MNVLHINCNYVGTALHRLMVAHLENEEAKLTVFTPLWDKRKKEEFKPASNEIISVCFSKYDKFFYFAKQHKILNSLLSNITDLRKYDLIHAFTLLTDGNVAYNLNKRYGIPYVVAIRDTDVNGFFKKKPYLRPLGIRIMQNASAVFFLSSSYKQLVFQKYLTLKQQIEIEKKTFVMPNGIDDFWIVNRNVKRDVMRSEERIDQRKLSVLCVGKINKRKNIPTLQEALCIMQKKGWEISLKVIGDIEDQDEYEKIIGYDFTQYYPAMGKEDLIKHYREADIFALASHTETFGLVYAEAMSQGLPVIYTRGQGFDGQFADGEIGFAVNDRDPDDIMCAIEKLTNEYARISENSINDVIKFKWDDICERYRYIYNRIIDGSNRF